MKAADIYKNKAPFRLLFGAVIAATLLSGWLGWLAFGSYDEMVGHQRLKEEITRLNGTVMHYDEVLTMSARMAAATGDPKWEQRYRGFEPALDQAIKKLLSFGSEEVDSAKETDAANMALVEMENSAFRWVRKSEHREASRILFSKEYERQKEIYARGMAQMNSKISAAAEKKWGETRASVARLKMALLLALLLSVAGWIRVFRAIRGWNRDLRALNDNLDKKVAEQAGILVGASKMAALGEMAGGVAHEINTPLAVITNVAAQMGELLDEGAPDRASLSAMASRIMRSGLRIDKIIQGLRSISRDGSRDAFRPEKIFPLVEKTAELCRERFAQQRIELSIEDRTQGAEICCRETEISQVLLNLLNNAHDAVQGLGEKWVKVEASEEAGCILISVSDSGKGIHAGIQEKIFQPFYTTKEIGKGTGLGLSISRGIIQNHGGELAIDPSSERTRFVLRLPKHRGKAASSPSGLLQTVAA